jgi:hypothetical protein
MPDSAPAPVSQRLPTILGLLEIALPVGAMLTADPGAVEGSAWYWLPGPGAVLTISAGAAEARTAAGLLDLERSLDDVGVQVLRDEDGPSAGEHNLVFLSIPAPSRTGGGHPAPDDGSAQRGRFRFWRHGNSAVRIGYRLDDAAAGQWRAPLDHIIDTAMLPGPAAG